jgi:hypothetical protein
MTNPGRIVGKTGKIFSSQRQRLSITAGEFWVGRAQVSKRLSSRFRTGSFMALILGVA